MEKITAEDLEVFVEYGVPEDERSAAKRFIKKYESSGVHMTLIKEYYSSLPEAREEPLLKIVMIDALQGTYLLGVESTNHKYLYCADLERAIYLGEYEKGIEAKEALLFFGFESNDVFKKQLQPFEKYPEFTVDGKEGELVICPVCSAKEGEEHVFGCTVEVCPWCEGQLSHCDCRFEKLGLAEISTEGDLEALEALLVNEGRIPFAKGQGPSYPTAGNDTLELKKK